MDPTAPVPRHSDKKERKHPEYQRIGSVRAAFDHETPTKTERLRARLDSSGSTRGAFFTAKKDEEGHYQPARRNKKTSKKSPPALKMTDLSSNAREMGDMASLALAGLSDDDFGGLLNGASPLKEKRPTTSKEPSRSFSKHSDSPVSDIEAPRGLVTIADDSYYDGSGDILDYSSAVPTLVRRPPPSRSAYAAARAQESEQSLDLNAIRSMTPPRRDYNLKESVNMQYSAASFQNSDTLHHSNAYFQYGDIPQSMHTSDRSGLAGMDIPLSLRTTDSQVMPNQQQQYQGRYPPQPQPVMTLRQQDISNFSSMARQQQDISNFSSMVQADYGTNHPPPVSSYQQPRPPEKHPSELSRTLGSELLDDDDDDDDEPYSYEDEEDSHYMTFLERIKHYMDPTEFLLSDAIAFDEDGHPIFGDNKRWTLPALIRHVLYNPEYPEFTSLQQFSWAVILGVAMGIYTAVWKFIIEWCVDFVWETIPGKLHHWGVFTDLDGSFPLPNYMWICPAIFGGVLSYIFVILPRKIPGQNEWIQSLHARGVQDHETFWPLFVLSTLGMSSGLSLGPELPLVLTAGMVGSWLGVISKQSMLQARVMNLTAASAAVGGFFGFPMAGAMFVLEIPHRMGLQYFEALSPATIASILAVLVNRMIVNNDVTGYYNYPFLTATLPSHIFTTAIVYGLVGSGIGVIYAESVMFLKNFVHDLFNMHHVHHHTETHVKDEGDSKSEAEGKQAKEVYHNGSKDETIPLVVHTDSKKYEPHRSESIFERIGTITNKILSCGIKHEPTRAAVAGTLAGLVVGITCMFVPHVAFWGEAQLQSLIDKGRTPLPVFGEEHKSTNDLTAYGFCLINPKDASEVAAGFSIGCAALITSAKIFVTGLSLGTGIVGGHFWGPLFVGCAASHLLTDLANVMQRNLGFGESLAAYPCVSILCMMGSTHVVTFRAHMAIMLILTLTISAFDSENSPGSGYTAGDYSAVFPLLVVSVFVSLMLSRGTVFYAAQRSRGDIMALPEVLCEPGKEGAPMVIDYDESDSSSYDSFTGSYPFDGPGSDDDSTSTGEERRRRIMNTNADDIEKEFAERQQKKSMSRSGSESSNIDIRKTSSSSHHRIPEPDVPFLPKEEVDGPAVLPRAGIPDGRSMTVTIAHNEHPSIQAPHAPSKRLEDMLSKPMEQRFRPPRKGHRRTHSAPLGNVSSLDLDSPSNSGSSLSRSPRHRQTDSIGGGFREPIRERSNSTSSSRAGTPTGLKKIFSYGEVADFQPSLLDQARARASSAHRRTGSSSSLTKRIPRGRHSRQGSNVSMSSASGLAVFTDAPPPHSRHNRQGSNVSMSSVPGLAVFTDLPVGSGGASIMSATHHSVHFSADASGGIPVDTGISQDEIERSYTEKAAGLNKSIWS